MKKYIKIILISALAMLCFTPEIHAAAQEWQTMTFTDDFQKDMQELEHYCLMHDVTVADVLWANNCTEGDLNPGKQILLPSSQPDVLAIWQKNGAWQPKALVQTTSAAAAERARGISGYPPKFPEKNQTQAQVQAQNSVVIPEIPQPRPQNLNNRRSAAEAEISAQISQPVEPIKPKGQNQPARPVTAQKMPDVQPQISQNKYDNQADSDKNKSITSIQSQSNLKNNIKNNEPIIVLSPNGNPANGPMRLIISEGQVKVVNLPQNAAPKTPKMPDLDHPFGAHLIPNPVEPLPPADPSRIYPRFQQNRAGAMMWPVDGKVSSYFGPRGRRRHMGIDIPMPPGTPIRVARDGVVAATGTNSTPGFRGYGNFVLVDHGGGIKTLYAHCLKVNVKAGQHLRQGQFVATVGRTGRATTDHLHFEVRINDKSVNPMPYLERVNLAKK